MTAAHLIDALRDAAEHFGYETEVVICDDAGMWPFSIHVEPADLDQPAKLVICLDTTGEPDQVSIHPPADPSANGPIPPS